MDGVHARGGLLLDGGRRYGSRPGWLARFFAHAASKLLDRIDAGLAKGTLYDTRRTLGGCAAGSTCSITLHDWCRLLRVATGGSVGLYEVWEAGEWSSDDPVSFFAVHRQCRYAERHGPRRGAVALGGQGAARAQPQHEVAGRKEHPRALRLRQRFLRCLARSDDELFLRIRLSRGTPASGPAPRMGAARGQARVTCNIEDRVRLGCTLVVVRRARLARRCDQSFGRAARMGESASSRRAIPQARLSRYLRPVRCHRQRGDGGGA